MSTAHRPTWDPARGKNDTKHASKVVSTRDVPAHTKLKYRQDGEGQAAISSTDFGEETREALKARLARAERDARNKKRKAEGLEPEPESEPEEGHQDDADEESAFKKPRLPERISGAAAGDGDAEDDEGEEDEDNEDGDDDEDDEEIEARARAILKEQGLDGGEEEDEDDEDEDEDDDDDETAQLMRELEKIKAEKAAAAAKKAEEEEREREKREEEIALGNPLLNGNRDERGAGSSARGRSPSAMSVSTEATGQPSFGVKRRWDDDVIFKNQAAGAKQDKSDFINDMTRSDFHKEFMRRYIK